MAEGIETHRAEARVGVRGHVRAFKNGPAAAGSPQSELASSETQTHLRLKRLAFLWAQAQGFSACAMEVSLPKCRYRADVAAYRSHPRQIGSTAVFECKQALCDLRRHNCQSDSARRRLDAICQRRQILETGLHAHYPTLQSADSLFPEFDSQSF